MRQEKKSALTRSQPTIDRQLVSRYFFFVANSLERCKLIFREVDGSCRSLRSVSQA